MPVKRINCLFLLVLSFLTLQPASARWATYQDAPAELEFFNNTIFINENGGSEEVIEKQIKILNESGRDAFATERLLFNESIQKIEILEAHTIIEGRIYAIPKERIETKPLASDIKGFDQLFQVFISYTHVRPGSQLYLRYRIITLKQPLPNYYSAQFYWGVGAYWQKSHIRIESKLPLYVTVNGPG